MIDLFTSFQGGGGLVRQPAGDYILYTRLPTYACAAVRRRAEIPKTFAAKPS